MKHTKVFIIMGQSNTLEMGVVMGEKDGTLERAVKQENLYGFLTDAEGKWTDRQDVRNVSVMVVKGVYRNDWLTISGNKIGIEIGIGHHLGNAVDASIMILKSSIGNRGLGWDLLPPGSEIYEFIAMEKKTKKETTWIYAGYKQYDDDTANAKKVLAYIGEH